MGGRGAYMRTNGFANGLTEHEFQNIGNIGGIKILQYGTNPNAKLPEYANTSSAYISINKDGEMTQLRIYQNHFPVIDIDLGHPAHHGLNDGEIHVHNYTKDQTGNPVRSRTSRNLTETESKLYSEIIRKMKESKK